MGRGSPVGPWSEDLERKRGLEGEAGPELGCRPQRIDRDPALSRRGHFLKPKCHSPFLVSPPLSRRQVVLLLKLP